MDKRKIAIFSAAALLLFGAGFWMGRGDYTEKIEQTLNERNKQDKRTVEKIVEKPSGERIIYRTIREKSDQTKKQTLTKTIKSNTWLVGLSYGSEAFLPSRQVYTLSVDRKVLGGLYMGLYGTSNGGYGVGIKYSF